MMAFFAKWVKIFTIILNMSELLLINVDKSQYLQSITQLGRLYFAPGSELARARESAGFTLVGGLRTVPHKGPRPRVRSLPIIDNRCTHEQF